MKFNMYSLKTSSVSRFFARVSRRCTVTLSTGKELHFEKGSRDCGCCTYEGKMTKAEEQEYLDAMMLMGI